MNPPSDDAGLVKTTAVDGDATQLPGDAIAHDGGGSAAFATGRYVKEDRDPLRGGVGLVYLAKDVELNRHVAIKEIRDEYADQEQIRERFLYEAEVTACLEHPGIVPVYGMGRYENGRLWYAMRYIKAKKAKASGADSTAEEDSASTASPSETLKDAIDRHHQRAKEVSAAAREESFRELLRRYVSACEAIDYAHSRGVVHRDIKPGNILLGRHGETLVVDWGMAKNLSGEERAPAAAESVFLPERSSYFETRGGLGTPGFMSPEQYQELPATSTRSDIYSLGATLYVILTGQAPFSGSIMEIARATMQGNFPKPRERNRAIPKTLEKIALKAMAVAPAERYATVGELAEDVKRWMSDLPISGVREPVLTRAARWSRRHKALVATLATIAAVMIPMLALVNAKQAKLLDENARLLAQKEDALKQKEEALASRTDALDREKLARREAEDLVNADRGLLLTVFKSLYADAPTKERMFIEFARSNPKSGLALAMSIGTQMNKPGADLARLERLLDESPAFGTNNALYHFIKTSLQLKSGKVEEAIKSARETARIDRLAAGQCFNEIGVHFNDKGDRAKAKSMYLEGLTSQPDHFWCHANYADCLYDEKKYDDAIHHASLAVKLKTDEGSPHNTIGRSRYAKGDRPGAMTAYLEGIKAEPEHFWCHSNYAECLYEEHRYDEAIKYATRAIELDEDEGAAHNTLGRARYAKGDRPGAIAAYVNGAKATPKHYWCLANAAACLVEEGKYDDAIAYAKRAIAVNAKIAFAHNSLGRALQAKGAGADARRAYSEGVKVEPDHFWCHLNYAQSAYQDRDYDEAIKYASIAAKLDGDKGMAHGFVGMSYYAKGDRGAAERAYQEGAKADPANFWCRANYAECLYEDGRFDEAIDAANSAIAVDQKKAHPFNTLGRCYFAKKDSKRAAEAYLAGIAREPGFVTIRVNYADLLNVERKYDEAIKQAQEAARIDPKSLWPHNAMGLSRYFKGDYSAAARDFDEAVKRGGPSPFVLNNMGRLKVATGDFQGAIDCYRKALRDNSDSPRLHFNFSQALEAAGKLDEAEKQARLASEGKEAPPRHLLQYAEVLLLRGKAKEAAARLTLAKDDAWKPWERTLRAFLLAAAGRSLGAPDAEAEAKLLASLDAAEEPFIERRPWVGIERWLGEAKLSADNKAWLQARLDSLKAKTNTLPTPAID